MFTSIYIEYGEAGFCLFCFVLLCFVLLCFVLFCFVLFCFVLFCFVLFLRESRQLEFLHEKNMQ